MLKLTSRDGRVGPPSVGELAPSWRTSPLAVRLVAAFLVVGFLPGCSAGQGQSEDGASASFATLASEYLDQAREGGASESQIAVLEMAQDKRDMSFELVRQVAQATVECLQEGGVDAKYAEYTASDGWVVPGYTYSGSVDMTEVATDAVAEVCDTEEFEWAYKLYETQPRAVATSNAYLLTREDDLRNCLEKYGYLTERSADGVTLADQALDVLDETGFEVNCLAESGIDVVR